MKKILLLGIMLSLMQSCFFKKESVLQQERGDLFFAMDLVFSHQKQKTYMKNKNQLDEKERSMNKDHSYE